MMNSLSVRSSLHTKCNEALNTMKKIDLHIHTIATVCDSPFKFSLNKLKEYVEMASLDGIAITNHNVFDLDQYREIKSSLNVSVFPGIEVSLGRGHILLISDNNDLENFANTCMDLSNKIKTQDDSIDVETFSKIFGDLNKFLLIPHYDKKPHLDLDILSALRSYITAGEVNSPKKFMYCINNENDLSPVYFSDIRVSSDLKNLPTRQTFVNCGDLSIKALKSNLSDKSKVALSMNEGRSLFKALPNGLEISTGLNVIIGERSSGKSYTIKKINEFCDNAKYIRQFSLVERDEAKDEEHFNELLSRNHSLLSQEYLKEFKSVVEDLLDVNVEENDRRVSKYLESLKKYANESERHDAFSKANLYREIPFSTNDNTGLKDLIKSTQNLIENIEYRVIIDKHLSVINLKKLIVELMEEYCKKEEERIKRNWINDLLRDAKEKLQSKSASTKIEDVDLFKVAIDNEKKSKV